MYQSCSQNDGANRLLSFFACAVADIFDEVLNVLDSPFGDDTIVPRPSSKSLR